MECCGFSQDTKFCGHCGKAMPVSAAVGLLAHLSGALDNCTALCEQAAADVEKAANDKARDKAERLMARRQRALAKWTSWRDQVRAWENGTGKGA